MCVGEGGPQVGLNQVLAGRVCGGLLLSGPPAPRTHSFPPSCPRLPPPMEPASPYYPHRAFLSSPSLSGLPLGHLWAAVQCIVLKLNGKSEEK